MPTLLNSRDIAALNRARALLKRLEESAWQRSLSHYDPLAPVTAWDLGRLSEAASVADDAILHVLATARASCHVKLTDAQLFGPDPGQEPAQTELPAGAVGDPEPGPAPPHEPASGPERETSEPESLPTSQPGRPAYDRPGHETVRGRVPAA